MLKELAVEIAVRESIPVSPVDTGTTRAKSRFIRKSKTGLCMGENKEMSDDCPIPMSRHRPLIHK